MIAYLFAGQGSQYVGMGKDLYESYPESKAVFDKANEVLGLDLRKLCFEGPKERLKLTNISQPAIFTVTLAAFEAFKSKSDAQAKFLAGLSLGEYSALAVAGCFSFEDGLRLVRKRAEIMDDAARRKPGKMAAVIDLAPEKVGDICLQAGSEVANLNAPGQVVISGTALTVDKAATLCLQAGAKRVVELEVSGGFHSSLMFEASEELRKVLEKTPMQYAALPVISNYTGQAQFKVAAIRENLIRQMYSPVKWEASMRFIKSQGVNEFIEFGPGKVLKGLMRRIDKEARVSNISTKEDLLLLGKRGKSCA
ncbi:ACP S-malonyltransferase [Candidatus Omnitrophota bacterium]